MVFALPASPLPRTMTPRLMSAAVTPDPVAGGPDQRFVGLGTRYAVDVDLPPMKYETARLWIGALTRAEREEATVGFTQPGLDLTGAPVFALSAAVSANATVLSMTTGGYTIRGGQFFNLVDGTGRRYLHNATQTGQGTIIIAPATRIAWNAGAAGTFADVQVQGLVQGPETAWTVDAAAIYGISFTIKERK